MMISLALVLSGTMFATGAATPCEDLASLALPHTTITSAEFVAAGPYTSQGRQPQQTMLPDHCRVAAVLAPSSDSHIEMEIWLSAAGWNGKFLAVGNGGWAGSIVLSAVAAGLSEGYATASNDTGHQGANATFALGHPEKIVDFAYRAIHEMAVQSKSVIEAFYDQSPRLSYFQGCSTGGQQGMMEAQRYPADFDAIIVGAPVHNRIRLGASQMYKFMEIVEDQSRYVPGGKIEMIADRVMAMCDANDGIVDGLVSDPEMCRFDERCALKAHEV